MRGSWLWDKITAGVVAEEDFNEPAHKEGKETTMDDLGDWHNAYRPTSVVSTTDGYSSPQVELRPSGVWECNYCRRMNKYSRTDCEGCGAPRERE